MAKKLVSFVKAFGILVLLFLVHLAALLIVCSAKIVDPNFVFISLLPALIAAKMTRISPAKATWRWVLTLIGTVIIAAALIFWQAGAKYGATFGRLLAWPVLLYGMISSLIFALASRPRLHRSMKWGLLGLAALLLSAASWVQLTWPVLPSEGKAYLEKHRISLADLTGLDQSKSPVLDPYLQGMDLFFTGEAHATQKNYETRLKLIRYFNRMAGIQYYLDEGGLGSAWIINRYLKNGDEKDLTRLMASLKGTKACNEDEASFIRKVREFNLSLPEEKRVIFIGIDLDFQADLALYVLGQLLPEATSGEPACFAAIREMSKIFDECGFAEKQYPKKWVQIIEEAVGAWKKDLEKNRAAYERLLGANSFEAEIMVRNIINTFSFFKDYDPNRNRDNLLYANFLTMYPKLSATIPKKFFGQWGDAHLYQRQYSGEGELAMMLQHDPSSPVKGKVLSVFTFYHHSYFMDLLTGKPTQNFFDRLQDMRWAAALNALAPWDDTLFHLQGEGSPFRKHLYFLKKEWSQRGTVTDDYFQFILLIRDSPASAPWKK